MSAKLDGAVLLLDERREVTRRWRGCWAAGAKLLHAKNIQEALALLEQREVAVLIADIDIEAENHLLFFNLLKAKYPQILVVVLTSASDSELVIHLINEAQIYRFLNKPMNQALMQQYLHSAIGRYSEYKSSPQLLARHHVQPAGKTDSGFGQMVLDRLKSFGNRFVLRDS